MADTDLWTTLERAAEVGCVNLHGLAAAIMRGRALEAEIERLRAIVDKLPKTADGVAVVPGMVYWFEYTNAPGEFSNDFASDIYNAAGETEFDKDCYSTREAAEAAKKAGGSGSGDHGAE